MRPPIRIRPIDAASELEVALVAERMRATLVETLGEARGAAMYTVAWLRDRVRFHLDAERSTGAVFLADDECRGIVGHTIVRMEHDDARTELGLHSTTWVEPAARRQGVAHQLLLHGEAWMRARELHVAATYTADTNERLIALYRKHGYALTHVGPQMVRLRKALDSIP